ncbi:MAG: S8 family serine peptidase [Deltaproteobacteria bacterium]|nr:S8 family serine peptidase [Deltaproteobacteria bacterium]
MKRSIVKAIVILTVMLIGNPVYSACDKTSCISLGNDLSMLICVEYQTVQYAFKLSYIQDSSGLFWKMDTSTFRQIQSGAGSCTHVESDLSIKICCVNYLDNNYAFTLNYTPYPQDPTGLYWKMDTATFVASPAVNDPLFPFQWHLNNTGQKAFSQSEGTPGEDLRMTQTLADKLNGLGVIIAVVDSGLEIAHEDLSANVIPNGSYNYVNKTTDPTPTSKGEDHGTSVAGICSAASMNGKGGWGVAPRSSLKGFNATKTNTTKDYIESMGGHPRSSDVDIFNMSFGDDTTGYFSLKPSYSTLYDSSYKLRGGKGGIYVKSAGNEFGEINIGTVENPNYYKCADQSYGRSDLTCFNAAAEEATSRPEVITVGAFNAAGVKSSYSTAGSTLWISAPGGEYGNAAPAIITTDLSGTDKGYSRKDLVDPTNPFEIGDPTYNPNCNYTSAFNGTSSSAPNASGAIALLLQINPNLTRRDVKHILAKTARKIDPNSPGSKVTVNIDGVDYEASQGWIKNAAGYDFNNWYGFGAVNVDAAVAMAKTYQAGTTLPVVLLDRSYGSAFAAPVAIPDNNASGVLSTLDVPEDLTIENLFVLLTIEHPNTAEVGIEITSPRGTKSILLNIRSAIKTGLDKAGGVVLGSNAFYGEKSKGTWTLKVLDSVKENTGTLNLFKLRILGY